MASPIIGGPGEALVVEVRPSPLAGVAGAQHQLPEIIRGRPYLARLLHVSLVVTTGVASTPLPALSCTARNGIARWTSRASVLLSAGGNANVAWAPVGSQQGLIATSNTLLIPCPEWVLGGDTLTWQTAAADTFVSAALAYVIDSFLTPP